MSIVGLSISKHEGPSCHKECFLFYTNAKILRLYYVLSLSMTRHSMPSLNFIYSCIAVSMFNIHSIFLCHLMIFLSVDLYQIWKFGILLKIKITVSFLKTIFFFNIKFAFCQLLTLDLYQSFQ